MANREFSKKWKPNRSDDYYTLKFQQDLLDQKNADRQKNIRFHLFDKMDPRNVIGDVAFSNIAYGPFCSCYLGYGLLGDREGEGLMTEALEAAIDHMFDQKRLHRIQANVIPGNTRSINVLENLGFRREGQQDKYLKIDGRWQDHYSYALINDDPTL